MDRCINRFHNYAPILPPALPQIAVALAGCGALRLPAGTDEAGGGAAQIHRGEIHPLQCAGRALSFSGETALHFAMI